MSVTIEILNGLDALDQQFLADLEGLLDRILDENDLINGEVAVAIGNDALLRRLNRKYRNKARATDVLSFSYLEPGEEKTAGECDFAIGDIYISCERAAGQARRAGHGINYETALLTIHGKLHLLGFDHSEDQEADLMREKELYYLGMLNFEDSGR